MFTATNEAITNAELSSFKIFSFRFTFREKQREKERWSGLPVLAYQIIIDS
jgi:hypothetical protein